MAEENKMADDELNSVSNGMTGFDFGDDADKEKNAENVSSDAEVKADDNFDINSIFDSEYGEIDLSKDNADFDELFGDDFETNSTNFEFSNSESLGSETIGEAESGLSEENSAENLMNSESENEQVLEDENSLEANYELDNGQENKIDWSINQEEDKIDDATNSFDEESDESQEVGSEYDATEEVSSFDEESDESQDAGSEYDATEEVSSFDEESDELQEAGSEYDATEEVSSFDEESDVSQEADSEYETTEEVSSFDEEIKEDTQSFDEIETENSTTNSSSKAAYSYNIEGMDSGGTVDDYIRWYSGDNHEEVFEVDAKSEDEDLQGNDECKVVHINVGYDTYGWLISYNNGMVMSLEDTKEYQLRFGQLPDKDGKITYGKKAVKFNNIEKITMYRCVKYFTYGI